MPVSWVVRISCFLDDGSSRYDSTNHLVSIGWRRRSSSSTTNVTSLSDGRRMDSSSISLTVPSDSENRLVSKPSLRDGASSSAETSPRSQTNLNIPSFDLATMAVLPGDLSDRSLASSTLIWSLTDRLYSACFFLLPRPRHPSPSIPRSAESSRGPRDAATSSDPGR